MKKLLGLVLLISSLSVCAHSQSSNPWELGAEYQHDWGKSFKGNDLGIVYEGFPGKTSWTAGVHYNFSSLGSGKETSKGSGFGISAGFRYGFGYGGSGNPFLGIRASFSFEKNEKGKSYSLFKPSAEFGYHLTFNNFASGGFTSPSIGIGYNFNLGIDKQKTQVFEGPTFNTRIAVGYRF